MADQNLQGTEPPPPVAAVDSAATVTPAVDSARGKADPDIVGLRKELRELRADIAGLRTQPAKVETTPGQGGKAEGDSVALAELAFRDALDDLDVKLDKGQRGLLRRLHRAEKPSDLGAWLPDAVASLGLSARVPGPVVQAAAPAPVVPAQTPTPPVTNTGAPGSTGIGKFPANPRDMSPAQIHAARASGEFGRIKDEWDAANGANRNPWAKPKKPAE